MTKIGKGSLVLTRANTYTGGTVVQRGKLVVENTTGSATGRGSVEVISGKLRGGGIIHGAVILGTGSGSGAILSPGSNAVTLGIMTIGDAVTFNADAIYKCGFNSDSATAGKVVADGATINGASFSFADFGSNTVPPGTTFTIIDNTAATPIAGVFANLADGSLFTVGSNTFLANYEGDDGNDLTLTVQ